MSEKDHETAKETTEITSHTDSMIADKMEQKSDSLLGVEQYGSEEEEEVHEIEEREKEEDAEELEEEGVMEEGGDDFKEEDCGEDEGKRLTIKEGGLNFVAKVFDDMGTFYGLITGYDEPYVKVTSTRHSLAHSLTHSLTHSITAHHILLLFFSNVLCTYLAK